MPFLTQFLLTARTVGLDWSHISLSSATSRILMGFFTTQGNTKKKQELNFSFWQFFLFFCLLHEKKQFQSKKQFGLLSGESLLKLFWPEFFHFWNILTYLDLDVCRATYAFCVPPIFCNNYNIIIIWFWDF